MPTKGVHGPTCEDCGATTARVSLDGSALCDRCADKRLAAATGWPELPEPPQPESFTGADGRTREFGWRLWRASTGIVAEAVEIGSDTGHGYHAEVIGSHEADVDRLLTRLRVQLVRRLRRQDLEPRAGRHPIMAGDSLLGRLVWNESTEASGLYDVIVGGQGLTWEEFGRALEPFEGWEFELRIMHTELVEDDGGSERTH